ncbi:fluoride efflux transporter CrcB [Nocardioides endophyticus]|uniref:Fluoride-specific ion channel FluC n=1 Tax=Nocardioides endophyticus TaxID=1353775 RepID=A0ABP8YWM6_9ACTN
MTALLVALGAALGAPLRFLVASTYDRPGGLPVGTMVVNVLGSGLLGAFSAMALSGHAMALLGTGFCGGFTTYSAFAVQTHGLGPRRGTAYAVVTIAVSLAACALGFWVVA